MKHIFRSLVIAIAIVGFGVHCLLAQGNPQAKILNYIRNHIKAGQPVRVTELYNTVFTSPEDHAALNKLYKDFFRIPMFVVQYQQRFSSPPSLKTIAGQFALKTPEEADTLLRVMETDPRVPKFITRNPKTGEITKVDVEMIRNDPRFAQGAAYELGGWVGRTAPAFDLVGAGDKRLSSSGLNGKVALLYVWFTGCPPCMKETPALVKNDLEYRKKGLITVAANADEMLGLAYDDELRKKYMDEKHITFPVVRWTKESDAAYGNISIFPTLFLIGPDGTITNHWVGYTNAEYGFDYHSCGVLTAIKEQSREIAQGVDESLEAREGIDPHELGAGDQGMMFGFAVDETPELMPLPITLAHAVAKELAAARKTERLPYLRPDGKSQVTVEYVRGKPRRVHTVVVAAQHDPNVSPAKIASEIRDVVVKRAIDARWLDERTRYIVNGTGSFVIGGPMGDAGLTGRKIIVDTYGGYARHGGGAFSGKDPTKVDRSAAYAARYIAKNVVAAGLAARFEVQIAYVIGGARPISLNVETFGTGTVSDDRIKALIDEHFDFRPGAIIDRFGLRRPLYRQTAAYGHFGRPELDLPWERTDLAAVFARAAGAKVALA